MMTRHTFANRMAGVGLAIAMASTAAGETGGAITFEFQGRVQEFATVLEGARTGVTRFNALEAVSLEGGAGPAQLVIEMSLPPEGAAGAPPLAVRVIYRPAGFRDYWVTPAGLSPESLRIGAIDLRSPTPEIVGSFSVPLCPVASPMHQPQLELCLMASGCFDTPLMRE